MQMRHLTSEEIESLASRAKVRRTAVENFLSTMGTNAMNAYNNADLDRDSYKWNAPTFGAIMKGIEMAQGPVTHPRKRAAKAAGIAQPRRACRRDPNLPDPRDLV